MDRIQTSDTKDGICAAAVHPHFLPVGKLDAFPQIFLPLPGNSSLPESPKDGDVLGYYMDLDARRGIAQAVEPPGRRTGIGQLRGFRGLVSG